jgi:hypothetical protein
MWRASHHATCRSSDDCNNFVSRATIVPSEAMSRCRDVIWQRNVSCSSCSQNTRANSIVVVQLPKFLDALYVFLNAVGQTPGTLDVYPPQWWNVIGLNPINLPEDKQKSCWLRLHAYILSHEYPTIIQKYIPFFLNSCVCGLNPIQQLWLQGGAPPSDACWFIVV